MRATTRAPRGFGSCTCSIWSRCSTPTVRSGHYRHDTLGQNLNRHYESPDPAAQPSCAAVKALLVAAAKEERLRVLPRPARARQQAGRLRVREQRFGRRRGCGDARVRAVVRSELAALRPEPLQLQPEEHGKRRQKRRLQVRHRARRAFPRDKRARPAPVHRRGQLQLQQVAEPSDGEERRREERRAAGRGRVLLGGSSREPERVSPRKKKTRPEPRPETTRNEKRDHETVRPRDAARRRPRAAVGGAGPARGEPSEPRALERVRIRARRAELGEGCGERRRERRLLR